MLQQSQKIRDLARDPGSRQEVTKRREKLDDGMHRVFAEVGKWIDDPKESGNRDIENLKREFGTLGNVGHYLMTDVGVKHHDDEEEDPAAPPPKSGAKPMPLLTPERLPKYHIQVQCRCIMKTKSREGAIPCSAPSRFWLFALSSVTNARDLSDEGHSAQGSHRRDHDETELGSGDSRNEASFVCRSSRMNRSLDCGFGSDRNHTTDWDSYCWNDKSHRSHANDGPPEQQTRPCQIPPL